MTARYLLWLLPFLCMGTSLGRAQVPFDPESIKFDESVLSGVKLGHDGPALLTLFKNRTLNETDTKKIRELIEKLGDDKYENRERATSELLEIGAKCSGLLRQATRHEDTEIARRAEESLVHIDKIGGPTVTAAAARLLGVRKPAGAVETLLNFVIFADDEYVLESMGQALTLLAKPDNKPDPLLLATLKDASPAKRGLAVEALIRAGLVAQQPELKNFLQDKDPQVRLKAGLALLDAKDKQSLAPLIALLGELPVEHCWRIEDSLFRLAGEQAPQGSLAKETKDRTKYVSDWQQWHTKNEASIDLAKLIESKAILGYTLLVEMDVRGGNNGKVVELGRDKKPRWEIKDLQMPMDAQVLSNDRVLITEYRGRMVTERNTKGDILWKHEVPLMPMSAQRLANGNTLIVCRNQLLEVDRANKEIMKYDRNQYDIMGAQKTPGGETIFVTNTGACVRLDAKGKEISTVAIAPVQLFGAGMDLLPNGNVLIPQYNTNKVLEYDPKGKQVAELSTQTMPTCVQRLPNGNTLVGSLYNQQVLEFDKAGKQIWDHRTEGRVYRVRRR